MKRTFRYINVINIFIAALIMMASAFIVIYVNYKNGTFSTIFNAIFYILEIFGIIMVGLGLNDLNSNKFLLGAREVIICLACSCLGNIINSIINVSSNYEIIYSAITIALSLVEMFVLVASFFSLRNGVNYAKRPLIFYITIGVVLLLNLAFLTLNCIFFNSYFVDFINFMYICGEYFGISLFSLSFLYAGYIFTK